MKEKSKLVDSLKEEVKIHDFPSTLAAHITELEISLEIENKLRQKTLNVIVKMNQNIEEDRKNIQWEVEVHAKAIYALDREVVGLKGTF